ncbi:MAG: DUF6527 family protein [Bacteroidota bacterium]
MKRPTKTLQPQFVTSVPEVLEDLVLYISIPFSTTIHLCPCGCGNEVVAKLSPLDWRLTYDGESVTLYPSIGSWSLPCQSHYWIEANEVVWAGSWSKRRIENARKKDRERKSKRDSKT